MTERWNHIRLELEPSNNAAFNPSSGIVWGRLGELSMGRAVMSLSQPFDEVIGEKTTLTVMVPDIELNRFAETALKLFRLTEGYCHGNK